MTESPNDKKFMREKVVKPKEKKGRWIQRVLGLVLFAVIFGIISAVSFVVSLPLAEKYIATETKAPNTPITIEKDEEPTTTAMETMESTIPSTEPDRRKMRSVR